MSEPGALRPTTRFSDRAQDYAKYRPSYAAAAIDWMLDGLGDPARIVAADVGAGTGISARLVADRGVRVLAVEPNEAMRSAAAAHPRVELREGTAERTGLEDASVDLVVCAQAFHWFARDAALAEFRRVLRPGGRLALMWNDHDFTHPFNAAYCDALRAATVPGLRVPHEDPHVLDGAAGFRQLPPRVFRSSQVLDADGVLGRALSASYVPKSGDSHARLMAALRDLHARHADAAGRVELVYRTVVFAATRR